MKAVTEFANITITKGLAAKAALVAQGKTAEEIQQGLGEAFKYADEKLTHFVAALGVVAENNQNLRRVLVMTLAEGENVPAKAVKVEEHYYVPEFLVMTPPVKVEAATDRKGGRRGGPAGGKNSKSNAPKGSPWGMTPEEKAAKNKGAAKTT